MMYRLWLVDLLNTRTLYLVFMSGEVDDEHVCPGHRTGEDTSGRVQSLTSVMEDPVVLQYLLPPSVVMTVSAAVEEY